MAEGCHSLEDCFVDYGGDFACSAFDGDSVDNLFEEVSLRVDVEVELEFGILEDSLNEVISSKNDKKSEIGIKIIKRN